MENLSISVRRDLIFRAYNVQTSVYHTNCQIEKNICLEVLEL